MSKCECKIYKLTSVQKDKHDDKNKCIYIQNALLSDILVSPKILKASQLRAFWYIQKKRIKIFIRPVHYIRQKSNWI